MFEGEQHSLRRGPLTAGHTALGVLGADASFDEGDWTPGEDGCPRRPGGLDVSGAGHRSGAGREEGTLKYIILLYGSQRDYDLMAGRSTDHPTLSPGDFAPMYAFMESWNNELVESGEFVDAQGLAAPAHTRRIQLKDGVPVVTDGPYAETQEVLAGYTLVECESFDRATAIAARLANCPYPADAPGEFVVDVRPIHDSSAELEL